jgi:hypothetical protein
LAVAVWSVACGRGDGFSAPPDRPAHVEFLSSFDGWADLQFEDYLNLVTRRRTRSVWGGAVTLWPDATNPVTGASPVVSFTVYADEGPEDQLTVADVIR